MPGVCQNPIMLEILGVSSAEEVVYTTLLDSVPLTARQLVRACGSQPAVDVESALESLEAKGFVYRVPGDLSRFAPTPPEEALEAMQLAREEELRRSRAAITTLTDRYLQIPRGTEATDAVVSIVDASSTGRRLDQELLSTRFECRALECPPYQSTDCGMSPSEREILNRGVRVRAVYDQAAMATTNLDFLREAMALGEESRLAGRLRLRMWLIDDRVGLIPVKAGQSVFDGMLVIRPSAVLDALSELFELIWERAVPLILDSGPGADVANPADIGDNALLGLLAAGLGDAAIARQLGLGLRTVERRISRIMVRLNAKTRFQAGVMLGRDDYYQDQEWTRRVA